jgi:hypothetical protein
VRLAIADDPDGRVSVVARAALSHAGLDLAAARQPGTSAWWRAGVADAIDGAPMKVAGRAYDAARSPRSTRGATRA